MRPQDQKSIPSHFRSLEGLGPWVTSLQGATDFLQGGLPHCVFSPDLLGECSRSVNSTRPEYVRHLPNRLSTFSERGLAFKPALRSQIL